MLDIRKGMNYLGLDYMIKIGGSLLPNINKCKQLADLLSEVGKSKRLLLFPGGGEIDNYIETYHSQIALDREIFHRATMLAMDQTALLFCNYNLEMLVPVDNMIDCRKVLDQHRIPFLLPSKIVFGLDPFRYTNRITSDGMALYFAHIFQAKRMVLIKSINGILDHNRQTISRLSFDEFLMTEQDCVDETFPLLAHKVKIPIDILNGLEYEQLRQYFKEEINAWGTQIN
ncbi:hypothetical protein [Paenibacillus ginsengihumi]|uniref:amino acid kinase family protein n=1 Tax=Paenibacillus ginsengihumi TaxID=431596 RepID=UPI00037D9AB1|nr:hypothetical protein [Paenibacillus ginsengihumi]